MSDLESPGAPDPDPDTGRDAGPDGRGGDVTPTSDTEGRPARFGPRRREARAFLELLAISGVAFTQPVLDVLGRNAELFVSRRASALDVILIALAVALAPPALAYAVELVGGLIWSPLRRWVHGVLVGAFGGLFVLQAVKSASELRQTTLLVAAIAGGIVVAILTLRVETFRRFLRFASVGPAVFLASFLFISPASEVVLGSYEDAVAAPVDNPARVLMIVFDEFPVSALLDGKGRIDRELYPNLAALADTSTWFRNTSTVTPYTEWAMPALLSGQYPSDADALPIAANYPDTIFRLLGGTYEINHHDPVQQLCPTTICAEQRTPGGRLGRLRGLVDASARLWAESAALEDAEPQSFLKLVDHPPQVPYVRQFIRSIEASDEPVMDYAHLLLPHMAWRLLPSLQDGGFDIQDPLYRTNALVWGSEIAAQEQYRRFLLQVQATDRLLGEVFTRLRNLGVWDDTLVVVTADHGEAFVNQLPMRSATPENASDIMWVPMFVKSPGQTRGVVDDRPMTTVDVLPTIADVLDVDIPWDVDGVSGYGPAREEFDRRLYQWDYGDLSPEGVPEAPDGDFITFPGAENFAKVLRSRPVPADGDPALRVYRHGEYGALIGQDVAPLVDPDAPGPSGYGVPDYQMFDAVRTTGRDASWTRMQGFVAGLTEPTTIAFAVNGRIAGLSRVEPFEDSDSGYYFVAMAPQFFADGYNEVIGYAVSGPPSAPRLKQLPAFENESVGESGE